MPRSSGTDIKLKGSPADMINFWNDFVYEVLTRPLVLHGVEWRYDCTDPYFKIPNQAARYLSDLCQQHPVANWVVITDAHNSRDGEAELRQQINRMAMALYRGRLLFNIAEAQKLDGEPITVVCQQSTNESGILLWHDFRDALQDQIVANLAKRPDIFRSSRRLDIIDWFLDGNDIYEVDGMTFQVELSKTNLTAKSTIFQKEKTDSNAINFTAWAEVSVPIQYGSADEDRGPKHSLRPRERTLTTAYEMDETDENYEEDEVDEEGMEKDEVEIDESWDGDEDE